MERRPPYRSWGIVASRYRGTALLQVPLDLSPRSQSPDFPRPITTRCLGVVLPQAAAPRDYPGLT